jgi:hypothetical protein
VSPYTGKIHQAPQLILAAVETSYGTDVVPVTANVVRAYDVQIDVLKSTIITRNEVRPFQGAQLRTPSQINRGLKFKVEAQGSGNAATAPAYTALLRAAKLAATSVAGLATIVSTAPVPVSAPAPPAGAWTFTKSTAYAGLWDSTVTIVCTTPGASGVAVATLSAPASPDGSVPAWSSPGVVVTNNTPLTLPGGAKVLPTIATPWAAGDTWTIALTPPGTVFAPVSTNFDSMTLYYYGDQGDLRRLTGVRGSVALTVEAGIPYWDFTYIGLYNPAQTAVMPISVDRSAWLSAAIASPRTVPYFGALGVQPVFKTATFDLQAKTSFAARVNQEFVNQEDHDAQAKITWDALPVSVLDLEDAITQGTTTTLDLRLGTAAGFAIHVHAGTASATGYTLAYDAGIATHAVDLSLYPVLGGDDISFKVM